ncbi:MAG: MTH1187 family thiamine-binding protein [candidate division KSB1 bacterium]
MLVEFRVLPVGTGEETKELVAKTVAIIEKSELDYQLTAMGTLLEGQWEEVMFVIQKCHEEVKKFAERVVTEIVIDDRKDLNGRLKGNVLEVEYVLGKNLKTGGLT